LKNAILNEPFGKELNVATNQVVEKTSANEKKEAECNAVGKSFGKLD
jgi:hypothetical protein